MVSDTILPGNGALLSVRSWDAANRGDAQIAALVDALLEHLPDNFLERTVDLRLITTRVNGAVKEARDVPLPRLTATDSDAGYFEEYPVRPGVEVCQFFMQCGYCKCATHLSPTSRTCPRFLAAHLTRCRHAAPALPCLTRLAASVLVPCCFCCSVCGQRSLRPVAMCSAV